MFETEKKTFEEHRDRLLRDHEGWFACILGSDILRVLPDIERVAEWLEAEHPNDKIYVQRITRTDEIQTLRRVYWDSVDEPAAPTQG